MQKPQEKTLASLEKSPRFIPESMYIKNAIEKAIHLWAENTTSFQFTYNWEVEKGRTMLKPFMDAKEYRSHHIKLIEFLNEKKNPFKLKYFLLYQLGKVKSERDVQKAINQLEQCICKHLDFIKVEGVLKQIPITYYLDKTIITYQRINIAYSDLVCPIFPSLPKLAISEENYLMQFRTLIKKETDYAEEMICDMWKLGNLQKASAIRASLSDAFRDQDITDPLCDLRVLKPDYWNAVCEELDKLYPEYDQKWMQTKWAMTHVFNDKDTKWLYFPKQRVRDGLWSIRKQLDTLPIKHLAPKLRYLLDVLSSDMQLCDQSLEILMQDKNNYQTLYEKACMNNLWSLARQLHKHVDLSKICIHMDDEILDSNQNEQLIVFHSYQKMMPTDNHELLRVYLDRHCAFHRFVWLDWAANAKLKGHVNVFEVLLADNLPTKQFKPRNFETKDMYAVFSDPKNELSLIKTRLLCPIKASWLLFLTTLICTKENLKKNHIAKLFMMLTVTSLGTTLSDETFSQICTELALPVSNTAQHYKETLAHSVRKAKAALCWEKYSLFKIVSPFPKELNHIIMNDMANSIANDHTGLDFTDEEILSFVP